jgi:hypothetical protein
MKWCLICFAAVRVGLRELKLPKILADCSTAALPFVIEARSAFQAARSFTTAPLTFSGRFAIGQGDRRTVRGELPHDRGSDAP